MALYSVVVKVFLNSTHHVHPTHFLPCYAHHAIFNDNNSVMWLLTRHPRGEGGVMIQ